VKETLTDKQGKFYFPSYTTLVQPFAKEGRARFIIYRAGYGSYPRRQISPPYFVDGQHFFSQELGAEGEISWESRTITVTFGLVELPRLNTRKERLRAIPGTPGDLGSRRLPLLYKAFNEERKRFGLGEVK